MPRCAPHAAGMTEDDQRHGDALSSGQCKAAGAKYEHAMMASEEELYASDPRSGAVLCC
jgi:hypothetical protein